MKVMLDSTCPRCGWTSSTRDLGVEPTRELAATHVCVDGITFVSGEPTERIVPGPGERTKLPEERR